MNLRFNLGKYRVVLYVRRVQRVIGINSNLKDGFHVPMLDIEGLSGREVVNEARRIMDLHSLGPCDIFSTGKSDHWHVYYMSRVPFRTLLRVMLDFRGSDPNHATWSSKRGHATLRFSEKTGRKISLYATLHSSVAQTFHPSEFDSFTDYQTGGL